MISRFYYRRSLDGIYSVAKLFSLENTLKNASKTLAPLLKPWEGRYVIDTKSTEKK